MKDNLILAIETSSARGSVAVGTSAHVLAARTLSAQRRHTGELLPAIQDLLAEIGRQPADVACLCFSQGPGSFTGLRVAATVARMWQSATGCRVVGVPSLEVIAQNGLDRPERPNRLAAIIDARQGKLFGAVYEPAEIGALNEVVPAGLHVGEQWLADLPQPCWVLGEGVSAHTDQIQAAGLTVLPVDCWLPDARQVLIVGARRAAAEQFCAPAEIVPHYLRPPECEEVYEQRRAEARERRGE